MPGSQQHVYADRSETGERTSDAFSRRRSVEGAAWVLAMQRTAGNHAVARMLHREPADAAPPRAKLLRQPTVRINASEGTTADLVAERKRLLELHHTWLHEHPWAAAKVGLTPYTEALRRLDVLLAERGNSTLTDAAVELTFYGHYLNLSGDGINISWPAVSGRPDARGGFDYSPERQRQQNVGPIPEGDYWLDPRQLKDLRERWFYERYYQGSPTFPRNQGEP